MTISTQHANGIRGALLAAAVAAPLALAAPAVAQDYPSTDETLDWTIAFGPGGGNDIMARSIIEILNAYDLYPGEISPREPRRRFGCRGLGLSLRPGRLGLRDLDDIGQLRDHPAPGRHPLAARGFHPRGPSRDG